MQDGIRAAFPAPLRDMARHARTEITGAGANEERIQFLCVDAALLHGRSEGLRGGSEGAAFSKITARSCGAAVTSCTVSLIHARRSAIPLSPVSTFSRSVRERGRRVSQTAGCLSR